MILMGGHRTSKSENVSPILSLIMYVLVRDSYRFGGQNLFSTFVLLNITGDSLEEALFY